MKVRNVSALGALHLPGYGDVAAGAVIDVPETGRPGEVFAGRAASPRLAIAHLELGAAVEALEHDRAAALREEIIGLDAGEGLLAQPDNWQPVKAGKPSTAEEAQP